ncbi:MAG: alkane 1-monooxygenase [Candidatus Neomarinimicrobiota bacterium]
MRLYKYLKYYISTVTLVLAIFVCPLISEGPVIFLLGFSLFVIIGDYLIESDAKVHKYKYKFFLDLPTYLNLPLLLLFMVLSISYITEYRNVYIAHIIENYLYLDISNLRASVSIFGKVSFVILSSLFIGIMGTVPAHELTHRKHNRFDMFIGNWLLAFSWDCAFAIEHVYGHHKNIGLLNDPATAKRGEGLYGFIMRATIKEQVDAWRIEISRLKRQNISLFSLHNRMLTGYARSLLITGLVYLLSQFLGLVIFLLISFISKFLLESINYIEHYGLIRVPGQPVRPAHSWNSNHYLSSIYLCNVTRHSAHHEKSNLKYWELQPYQNAPKTPFGYLSVLYLTIFFPHLYRRLMKEKLRDWDLNFANSEELKIIKNMH